MFGIFLIVVGMGAVILGLALFIGLSSTEENKEEEKQDTIEEIRDNEIEKLLDEIDKEKKDKVLTSEELQFLDLLSEFNNLIIESLKRDVEKGRFIRKKIYYQLKEQGDKIVKSIPPTLNSPVIDEFKEHYQKYFQKDIYNEINKEYIKNELIKSETLLNNIDGKALDEQQKMAVIIDDDAVVIAGAGSGKTLTIAAKVAYLVKVKKVDPQQILLVTYTKKAAEEMKERIVEKMGINAKISTFHAYGKSILDTVNDVKKAVLEESQVKTALKKLLKEDIIKQTELFSDFFYFCDVFLYNDKTIEVLENEMSSIADLNYMIQLAEENKNNPIAFENCINNIEAALRNSHLKVKVDKNNNIRIINTTEFRVSDSLKNYIVGNRSRSVRNELEELEKLKKERWLEGYEDTPEFEKLVDKIDQLSEELSTLKKESVKSREELMIANYLFLNGIRYEYEANYEQKTGTKTFRQYTPDFYLVDYGIYLEHFGINKEGKAPQYSFEEENRYIEGIEWKRALHRKNNTVMIETYSWENSEGVLLKNLERKLKDHNVNFQPVDEKFVVQAVEEAFAESGSKGTVFIRLLNTFLSLFKSNGYELSELDKFVTQSAHPLRIERENLFFKIFRYYYNLYEKYLLDNDKMDFADMLGKASKEIKNVPTFFEYIIVDEFQDTSISKYNILKELIKKDKNIKIMAVGDDWQSIYRFSGGDISLITNFEKYFGKSHLLKIEKTYRNSQELIDIASSFIMKNKNQIKKSLKSVKRLGETAVKGIFYETTPIVGMNLYFKNTDGEEVGIKPQYGHLAAAFGKMMDDISKRYKSDEKAEIMLLGRYNMDIDKLVDRIGLEKKHVIGKRGKPIKKVEYYFHHRHPNLHLNFHTVHSSKGLEADEVIIINNFNSENEMGFPSCMSDDSLLEYVLAEPDLFPYSEERRLFYVALTRTKNYVYLIIEIGNKSIFVQELEREGKIDMMPYCSSEKYDEIKNCI